MIVLVCGGRSYSNSDRVDEILDALHAENPISKLVHGAATGADKLARRWSHLNKAGPVKSVGYPANWSLHGRAAGPIRNSRMLEEQKPDLVVAFPGGRGTQDMIRKARAANVPVIEVE